MPSPTSANSKEQLETLIEKINSQIAQLETIRDEVFSSLRTTNKQMQEIEMRLNALAPKTSRNCPHCGAKILKPRGQVVKTCPNCQGVL